MVFHMSLGTGLEPMVAVEVTVPIMYVLFIPLLYVFGLYPRRFKC